MHILKNTQFDFLRWRWHALVLSWVVIIAGMVMVATKGIVKGVEFAGGTVLIEKFEQPVSAQQVRAALEKAIPRGGESTIAPFGDPGSNQMLIRVPYTGGEAGADLSKTAKQVAEALRAGGLPKFSDPPISTEIVGPTVGQELTTKGLLATTLSLVFILGYLAFRFQFSFGVGAIVATVHDLLITLAFIVFFGYDMTLNVIAAILTMAGFSTNDTIVIFDRIRENLKTMRRDSLYNVINISVNQTLTRTIITSGTALLTSLALFFFGGEVLHGFAFTMVVGIITGTYSSVFIAAAIVSFWRTGAPARAAASAPAATAAPQQPQRKKQRNARAS